MSNTTQSATTNNAAVHTVGPLSLKDALASVTASAGNKAWQTKLYHFVPQNEHLLGQAPAQVQALVMQARSTEGEFRGDALAAAAKAAGLLNTKQNPHLIFAYYRKYLEVFGVATARYAVAQRKA